MPKRKYAYLFVIASLVLLLSLVGLTGCPGGQTYTLTTNVSPPGAGSVSPPGGDYDSGMSVTLTATPASGYTFDHWGGSATGTNPTTTIIMNSDKSVTAYFEAAPETKFTLTTNVSPSGAGSVSPSGGEYDPGATVTLTASAGSGYKFAHWSGSATGSDTTTTITMDSDKSVTANFEQAGPAVLFSDDFSQDTGVWDIFSDANGKVFYENGWLHVIDYTGSYVCTYSYAYQWFTDFVLEVETKLVDGTDDNWHIVTVRSQGDLNYYDFGVSADGYYLIKKVVDGKATDLVGPIYSSHINQGVGAVNLVHVECIGSSLSLSVNGHLLETVTDGTFSAGDISLAAIAYVGTFTEVAFDNIIVTEP
jgi:uncharacterized repeat protein (TIGR02543 family)